MTNHPTNLHTSLSDDRNPTFSIRWRGKQEGPYPLSVIEARLAENKIGLLHEVLHNGEWVTLREYFAERDATLRAERRAQEEQERQAREEAERQAKEREEQRQAELLAEERRKNDLMQMNTARQNPFPGVSGIAPTPMQSHRGGMILTFGLIGLLLCGPFGVAAWVMGSSDLARMDAGLMDTTGRTMTSSGRVLGILATVIWIIGFVIFFLASAYE